MRTRVHARSTGASVYCARKNRHIYMHGQGIGVHTGNVRAIALTLVTLYTRTHARVLSSAQKLSSQHPPCAFDCCTRSIFVFTPQPTRVVRL